MKAMRNLIHAAALGIWAVLGVALTLRGLTSLSALTSAGCYWLWFGGLAAITSWAVSKWEKPWAALGVHFAALLVLQALPRAFPLHLLRYGFDLVGGA
jgi:hypothetical protein